MAINPDHLFALANPLAMLGWVLLVLAPRWRFTQALVLSGAWSLGLAVAFGSLAQVAALFQDPWALLAGWVHYLCFDLFVGAWEVRDAQQRGLPHGAVVPALVLTFLFGPVGLLVYFGVRGVLAKKHIA
jgi:hypothetical protein